VRIIDNMFEHRKEVNRQSEIVISEQSAKIAVKLGLCDAAEDIEGVIKEILWLAVPTNHTHGNKRYKDWIFRVIRGVLTGIHLVKCINCDDSRRLEVYDECSICEGTGCSKCNGGLRKGTIPCPTCSTKI